MSSTDPSLLNISNSCFVFKNFNLRKKINIPNNTIFEKSVTFLIHERKYITSFILIKKKMTHIGDKGVEYPSRLYKIIFFIYSFSSPMLKSFLLQSVIAQLLTLKCQPKIRLIF